MTAIENGRGSGIETGTVIVTVNATATASVTETGKGNGTAIHETEIDGTIHMTSMVVTTTGDLAIGTTAIRGTRAILEIPATIVTAERETTEILEIETQEMLEILVICVMVETQEIYAILVIFEILETSETLVIIVEIHTHHDALNHVLIHALTADWMSEVNAKSRHLKSQRRRSSRRNG
jgi:hypothetical protein